MGDSGEGLIDADSRIQERMEELERERSRNRAARPQRDPAKVAALESLRLARIPRLRTVMKMLILTPSPSIVATSIGCSPVRTLCSYRAGGFPCPSPTGRGRPEAG